MDSTQNKKTSSRRLPPGARPPSFGTAEPALSRGTATLAPPRAMATLSRFILFSLWAFTLVLGGYVYFDLHKAASTKVDAKAIVRTGVTVHSARAESRVNRYLHDLNLKLESQKVLSQGELEKAKREIGRQLVEESNRARAENYLKGNPGVATPPVPGQMPPVGPAPSHQEQLSERDLHVSDQFVDVSPAAEIQGNIAIDDEASRLRHKEDQAYIAQFIENAREHGYEIEVDDQYQVTSIHKIGREPARVPNSVKSSSPSGSH